MVITKSFGFTKNVFFLFNNKMLAFVVGILFTLIIANYLGPAKYGLVIYFISFAEGLSAVIGLNYITSLFSNVFPKEKSYSFFKTFMLINIIAGFTLFLVLFFFAEPISILIGKGEYSTLLAFTSILALTYPVYLSISTLFKGFKLFGKVLKVMGSVAILNLVLAAYLTIFGGMDVLGEGIIIAKIITVSLGILVFGILLRKLNFSRKKINWSELKEYSVFAIPLTYIRAFNAQAVILFIGWFLNPVVTGFYYLIEKIVSLLVSSILSSFHEVVLPYSLEKYKDKKTIGNYLSLTVKAGLIISLIISILIIIIARPVIGFFFPDYVGGVYLVPLFCVLSILSSFSTINTAFVSLNKMKYLVLSYSATFAVFLIAGFTLTPIYDAVGLIVALIFSSSANIITMYLMLPRIGVKINLIPSRTDLDFFKKSFKTFLYWLIRKKQRGN
ncbi:MAG: oligosaccharide flippase family protein [archaeon]